METRKAHPLLVDPAAVRILEAINYDFSTIACNISFISQLAWIARSLHADRTIREFLERYPTATVVNLGCGLDTTFERVDNGRLSWYDLDLPDVIDLRKTYILEGGRRKSIACSLPGVDGLGTRRQFEESRMSMYRTFLKEVASAGLPTDPDSLEVVTASRIACLPEPAQRYLQFMGVVGRPQDWSFRLGFTGRFRTKPQQSWMKCEAWQYSSRLAVARIFHIRIRFGGLLSVIGRDTYVKGRGRMLIRLADLFTIENGTGDEYDTGELVTYLNDAVMIAPTMLLVPEISWSSADASSFDVTLTDRGRAVSARVMLGADGAPVDFSTEDRFCYSPDEPKKLIRARWTTPIAGWEVVDGRPQATGGQAVWHLPQGPFAYADFRLIPGSLAFNVRPGS